MTNKGKKTKPHSQERWDLTFPRHLSFGEVVALFVALVLAGLGIVAVYLWPLQIAGVMFLSSWLVVLYALNRLNVPQLRSRGKFKAFSLATSIAFTVVICLWLYLIAPKPVTSPDTQSDEVWQNSPLQNHARREIVDVTPDYLEGFFDGRTVAEGRRLMQPYVGKWINISGRVRTITPALVGNDTIIFLQNYGAWLPLSFQSKWKNRTDIVGEGSVIRAICQIGDPMLQVIPLNSCDFTT